jgi:hypothetical protein
MCRGSIMARDYEDIFDTEDLDDDELRRVVRELLRDNRSIDAADISIHINDGKIVLEGRVGTDAERRIAERVVSDRLGLDNVRSRLIVDPLRRVESPEAADEQQEDEGDNGGESELLPTEEHSADRTADSSESTELGIPWIPPSSQTPEGMNGPGVERDAERDSY